MGRFLCPMDQIDGIFLLVSLFVLLDIKALKVIIHKIIAQNSIHGELRHA